MTSGLRFITSTDAGKYYSKFCAATVADAVCIECLAPYLAWVANDRRSLDEQVERGDDIVPFFDLSHKHSFNDKPAKKDYPKYKIEWEAKRTPWKKKK